MSQSILNSGHLAWNRYALSGRGIKAHAEDYPVCMGNLKFSMQLLFQLLNYLLDNYTTKKEDDLIGVIASGKVRVV